MGWLYSIIDLLLSALWSVYHLEIHLCIPHHYSPSPLVLKKSNQFWDNQNPPKIIQCLTHNFPTTVKSATLSMLLTSSLTPQITTFILCLQRQFLVRPLYHRSFNLCHTAKSPLIDSHSHNRVTRSATYAGVWSSTEIITYWHTSKLRILSVPWL